MKKSLLILLLPALLLVGCNASKEDNDSSSSSSINSSSVSTGLTQDQIKSMFRSDLAVFESKIKTKTKFSINGSVVAPDKENTGMYQYDVNADLDIYAGDGSLTDLVKETTYMKTDITSYLMEEGVVNETPVSRQKSIRVAEKTLDLPIAPKTDTVEYTLDKDNKYTKTINRGGNVVMNPLIQEVVKQLQTLSFDELPKDAKYTYDDGLYSVEFMFKDLEGTQLMEMVNLLLGMFPEINETIMMYKDKVVINISNIKLDATNKATFDIALKYPLMGAMYIDAIKGSFSAKYAFNKIDCATLPISKTYYSAKKGDNLITSAMLNEEVDGETKSYVAGLVVDAMVGFEIPKEGEQIDLSEKTYEIVAPNATSVKFLDRYSHQEIDIQNQRITIGLLDSILVEVRYPEAKDYTISINEVAPIEGEII